MVTPFRASLLWPLGRIPCFVLAYISAYVFNVPLARSLAWFLGLLCSGILYGVGFGALL